MSQRGRFLKLMGNEAGQSGCLEMGVDNTGKVMHEYIHEEAKPLKSSAICAFPQDVSIASPSALGSGDIGTFHLTL